MATPTSPTTSTWRRDVRRFCRNRLALIGLIYIVLLFAAAFAADVVAPYHYETTSPARALEGVSTSHFFGTDELGRDLFSTARAMPSSSLSARCWWGY
jgi:peptide/nickel transport system permease protein